MLPFIYYKTKTTYEALQFSVLIPTPCVSFATTKPADDALIYYAYDIKYTW